MTITRSDPVRPLITIQETATLLNVSVARAYFLARTGEIPCVRIGSQVRVNPGALEEWILAGGSRPLQEDETQ